MALSLVPMKTSRKTQPRRTRQNKPDLPPDTNQKSLLTAQQILTWADELHARTGEWPRVLSGKIADAEETWQTVDYCLRSGSRCELRGSSLARLLAEKRDVRNSRNLPRYSVRRILEWADAHHRRNGEWPMATSGPIGDAPGETWMGVDMGLRNGLRGLSGGSSLAQVLEQKRGKRNKFYPPRLYSHQILAWADAFHKRNGKWPTRYSGSIEEAPDDHWHTIDENLSRGGRGLPGGSSLSRLLAERRGARNRSSLPRLTPGQILSWAKFHHEKTGKWPTREAGPIAAAPMENWLAVDGALRQGARGLPGHSSLAQLLEGLLGVRNHLTRPPLSVANILRWADEHRQRAGNWPTSHSGAIAESPNESWGGVDTALAKGTRGLKRGGLSLARLLERHRGVRNSRNLPPLKIKKILHWADEHQRRTGEWPTDSSGAIPEAPEETWLAVEAALRNGRRGLSGGSSLAQVLEAERGRRNPSALPSLSDEQILVWADAYRERTDKWPTYLSGTIAEAPEENWSAVNGHLGRGGRGLPGGYSLARLLADRRGARNRASLPKFTIGQILFWATEHRRHSGKWPVQKAGTILSAPLETWSAVDTALRTGSRGLAGNSSLSQLLDERIKARKTKAH